MLKIGITGGIGSGKSTVCKVWQSLGAYLINADAVAKDLMQNNRFVKQRIIETFGEESFFDNGSLNRAFLAGEAFGKNRVSALNNIVHPAVFKETDRLMEEAGQEGYNAVVYEAALLFQHGRPEKFDTIVLVVADEGRRIEWVSRRDEASKEDIQARVDKQQNFDSLINKADIVIRNNGTLKELEKQAERIYKNLVNKRK